MVGVVGEREPGCVRAAGLTRARYLAVQDLPQSWSRHLGFKAVVARAVGQIQNHADLLVAHSELSDGVPQRVHLVRRYQRGVVVAQRHLSEAWPSETGRMGVPAAHLGGDDVEDAVAYHGRLAEAWAVEPSRRQLRGLVETTA